MSLKDIFKNSKALSLSNFNSASLGIESPSYLQVSNRDKNRYKPQVDYSDISNFAKYGLAESYYEDAINNILKSYPFDGSGTEKLEWRNSSSDFDNYVLDYIYPKQADHIQFDYDAAAATTTIDTLEYSKPTTSTYINVKGVMNTGSYQINPDANMIQLSKGFPYSNVYDEEYYRTSNIFIDPVSGNTVEFWYKHGEVQVSSASVLFDIWNGENSSDGSYGRISLNIAGSPTGSTELYVKYLSGTTGIGQTLLHSFTSSNNWNHYAISFFKDSNSDLAVELYLNSELVKTLTDSDLPNHITGSLTLKIGSVNYTSQTGYGALSGNMDEFRFWKKRRTHEDISRFYYSGVNGGSSAEDSSKQLGIYYKFNEGHTGLNKYDSVALDYSGRTSHGTIYGNIVRVSGSAMVSASVALSEEKDPVVWKESPILSSTMTTYKEIGRAYDLSRNSSLYSHFPDHMIEEDDNGELKKLSQIIGSYFDSTILQVKDLSRLKDPVYISGTNKPNVFADKKLLHQGFISPEIFETATELEQIYNRSENEVFSDKLNNLKNTIYENVYNNIVYIMKSKGTEKSFRNLIRCYGVDDSLISINYYTDNETHDIVNNFSSKTYAKNYINFGTSSYTGYLFSDIMTMSSDFQNIEQSVEAEVYFPKKFDIGSKWFNNDFPYISSSIFGVSSSQEHEFGMYAYCVRDDYNSPSAKFVLTSSAKTSVGEFPLYLETPLFEDLYDNNKWLFSISVEPQKRNVLETSGTLDTDFLVTFRGYNYLSDQEINSFSLTSSVSNSVGLHLLTSSKFVKAGYNNSIYSDIKLGSLKYLSGRNSSLDVSLRAKDTELYGFVDTDPSAPSGSYNVSKFRNLISYYNFDMVTGSDGSGNFEVYDITSGSNDLRYGNYDKIFNNEIRLNATGFDSNSSNFISRVYVESAQTNLPEEVASSRMINILEENYINYNQNSLPIKNLISFEKNMSTIISREMLSFLGGVEKYSDLVFNNVGRYSHDYSELNTLKSIFFENVSTDIDFNKFFKLYKWIDSSLNEMLRALVPSSAEMNPNISNVIESHLFERNKYWNKLPRLKTYNTNIIGTVSGVGARKTYAVAPASNSQYDHAKWWENLFDPFKIGNTTANADLNLSRANLLSASKSQKDIDNNHLFQMENTFKDYEKIQILNPQILQNTNLNVSLSSIENINQYSLVYYKPNFKISNGPNNKFNIPFYFTSGSISGGYSDAFNNVGKSIGIEGIHTDTVTGQIQSNFTKQVVGGYPHRRNNVGVTDRFESFGVNIDSNNVSVVKTARINLSKDNYSKTIINVKNISGSVGNYDYNYEIINGGDRVDNNLWFRSYTGTLATTPEIAGYNFVSNHEVPEKKKSDSFIVSRFTSPGALDETSVGYLDNASEQFCVYSTMNYRNLYSRKIDVSSSAQHFDINDYIETPTESAIPSFVTFAWEADSITVGDGNTITTWTDSIAGKELTQTTPSSKPLFRADTNGSPAVEFDGIADHLLSTDVDITGLMDDPAVPNFTSIVVLSNRHSASAVTNWAVAGGNSASNNAIFGLAQGTSSNDQNYLRSNSASSNVAVFSPAATSAKRAVTLRTETTGATFEVFLDGTSVVSAASPSVFTINRFCVGALARTSVGNYTTASVHAIYLINTNASTGQLDEIWTYIRNKWGTP